MRRRVAGPFVVIGSGPTGVAVSSALRNAGREVILVDVGRALDPARAALLVSLAGRAESTWTDEERAAIRGPAEWDPVIPKLAYGSDFPYARDPGRVEQRGTRCLLSEARGGLSNVWGAAVLPAPESERGDWPGAARTLPFDAVEQLVGVAGERDELADLFPFSAEPEPPVPLSRQASAVLDHLRAHASTLTREGVRFGRSRLAVRTRATGHGPACSACGLCLSGCPYGAIWNAASIVRRLSEDGSLSVVTGRVRRLEPGSELVRVHLDDQVLEAERVFVAAGPLGTLSLVSASLGGLPGPVSLRHQPYFLLPLVAARDAGDVEQERLHTLAQLFLELDDRSVSQRLVHLQLYGHNEVIRARVAGLTRFFGPLSNPLRRGLSTRLLALQGYLHSDEGAPIRVTSPQPGRLVLESGDDARAKAVVRRVVTKLLRLAPNLGFAPVPPMLHHGLPGEGNHVGGAFPMRERPGPLETDPLGRLAALPGVHLVDASVLPSLPATTFTLTAMANAHRIATAAAGLSPEDR